MTDGNRAHSGTNPDPSLSKAIHDLEKAEAHLQHARADEAAAEHELADALKEINEAKGHKGEVTVHVVHVNETKKASFEERVTDTLNHVWEKSYHELKIPRQPKDIFQTGGEHPVSLMGHLNLSLKQAHEQKVITNYHFGIACETGGA